MPTLVVSGLVLVAAAVVSGTVPLFLAGIALMCFAAGFHAGFGKVWGGE